MADDRWDFILPKGYSWKDELIAQEKLNIARGNSIDPYEIRMGYQQSDQYYKHSDLVGCSHEWVNVGFHFDKYVCKKCNKDEA